MGQQRHPLTGRDHPGMAGEIISERRATSNRNGGRHHPGIPGDFRRNPQTGARRLRAAALWPWSWRSRARLAAAEPNPRGATSHRVMLLLVIATGIFYAAKRK